MKLQHFLVVAACLAWQVWGQEEAEPAVRRGLLKRGLLSKGKQATTTTTTTQIPEEELEYDDAGAELAGNNESAEPSTEAPTASTEGKKLVGGGVRPFRSNTDLLETLKRKRAQAAEAKHGHPSTSAPAVTEASTETQTKGKNGKKRFNSAQPSEDAQTNSKTSRNRFGRPPTKATPETEADEQVDAAPPAATATRTGRNFRRGGN